LFTLQRSVVDHGKSVIDFSFHTQAIECRMAWPIDTGE